MPPKASPSKLPAVQRGGTGKPVPTNTSKQAEETKLPSLSPDKQGNSSAAAASAVPEGEAVAAAAAAAAAAEAAAAAAAAAAAEAEAAAAAEAAAEAAAAEAAAQAEAKARGNGNVTLLYELYSESFSIVDGSLTAAVVDDTYCLSDVMPGCVVHLSEFDAKTRRAMEDDKSNVVALFVSENPKGIFHGLEKDRKYFVCVEQEAEQLKRDQLMMRKIAAQMEGGKDPNAPSPLTKDDGRVLESCSCVYGNPCVDEYGCKDWGNRYAVATKNGWKGF